LGRLGEAESYAREGVARSGRWSLLLGALGYVLGQAEKRTEAQAILGVLKEQTRQRYVPRYHFAFVNYGLRDVDACLAYMEASLAERSGVAVWMGVDPHVNWLRSEARYRDAVRRLGVDVLTPASAP
jgi:hypothetical protein